MSLLPGIFDPLDDWDSASAVAPPVPGQAGKVVTKELTLIQRIVRGQR